MPAANALQTLGFSVAFTVGPLLGAALVAAFDYGVAYTVDALLFTAALFARLPAPRPAAAAVARPVASASGWARWSTGSGTWARSATCG